MNDVGLIQLLFDSEPVISALGFPVNAEAFAASVRGISAAKTADEVAAAWNALAGAVGPKLTAALLSGEEWRWISPPTRPLDDYDSDDLTQAVSVGDDATVIGRAVMDGAHLLGVRFEVRR